MIALCRCTGKCVDDTSEFRLKGTPGRDAPTVSRLLVSFFVLGLPGVHSISIGSRVRLRAELQTRRGSILLLYSEVETPCAECLSTT